MTSKAADYFSGDIAINYDDDHAFAFKKTAMEPCVDLLAELAGKGPVLEFAIGTGRIAIPLISRGLKVDGIEYSADMIAELQKKPAAKNVRVLQGDMATTKMGGNYSLVFLVFNTLMNLTTQSSQVACFQNAADHLKMDGFFVVEVIVPRLRSLPPGQLAVPFRLSDAALGFDTYDTVNQGLTSHHFKKRPDGTGTHHAVPFRYVWPAELDLMAQMAGMRLRSRWADWDQSPFTAESVKHISVWEKI